MLVQSLGWEDPLEEETATHSVILAWKNLKDRGAWRATVLGVAKSRTRLRARTAGSDTITEEAASVRVLSCILLIGSKSQSPCTQRETDIDSRGGGGFGSQLRV